MDISYDVTATLRSQDHGHPPCVLLFEPRSPDGVPRIYEDICPTLNTAQGGQRQPCVLIRKEKDEEGTNRVSGRYNDQD